MFFYLYASSNTHRHKIPLASCIVTFQPSSSPLLDVRNLTTVFRYGERETAVVDDVSFSLERGKTLGIVGESGCGKTVTALSIMRLIPSPPGRISTGEVLFEGKNLLKLSAKEMQNIRGKDIAMVFQEPMTSLNPVFPVGDQIAEVLFTHEKISSHRAMQRVLEMMKLVGIPAPAERYFQYPHQLSGGMRQRILIAMGLICNPKLLIADEPTTALDVTVQAQILELFRNLQQHFDMGLLMITHNLGIIAEVADEVAVMYAAKIVEHGTIDNIFARPLHPYTFALLKSIPKLNTSKSSLVTIPGNVPNPLDYPVGCHFCTRCPYAVEVCFVQPPPMTNATDGHSVACWCWENIELDENHLTVK
ncbi:MAG: ABC transporter ATP-binding protein [Chlorobi bacterium]|nr:ABC transporter ATP-binding protein [Chlorobiota bacterium]